MNKVDYCVTTMGRPDALERLLLSIAAREPNASIHVADQSEAFDADEHRRMAPRLERAGLRNRPSIHALPFDCGVSAARNHLVESTPGDYKLILDDDFQFVEETDVGAMIRLLDAFEDVGAVGGAVSQRGRVRNAASLLSRDGGRLRQLRDRAPLREHEGVRFKRTDCVPQFVLIRRELFAHTRWDPALKTAAEHFDFFLRVKESPYAVLYTPDATIDHPPAERSPAYRQLRLRGEFLRQMMRKHGLVRLETFNGMITELTPNGRMVRYRSSEKADEPCAS